MFTDTDTHPFPLHVLCAALVAGAMLFLASCKESPVEPENSSPNITQEISPLEGFSPLKVKINANATDPDGAGDIASYSTVVKNSMNSDSLVFTRNPTDTTVTLTTPSGIEKLVYSIESNAIDREGKEASKKTDVAVYAPVPGVSQKATLQDSINIKYEASLTNLDDANLDVSKNGSVILSKTIKAPNYSEVFSYPTNPGITKGNYDFTLRWKTIAGKDTSSTTSITIPNYLPVINLSGLQTDMDEGTEITLDLEGRLTDRNPEDNHNPVPLTNATSTDGKTEVSFSGYKVMIKGIDGKTGNYQARVDFGSDEGGRSSTTIAGYAYDLLDIQGFLEDNETHSRQPGIVRVYDGKIDPTTGTNRRIGEAIVDASGEFNTRFNFRVEDLVDYILVSGKKVESGIQESFVRTMKLPGSDQKGLILRVVPYDGLAENGITPEDFSRHVREVYTLDGTNGKGTVNALTLNPVIYKWKEVPDFIISTTSSDSTVHAFFNQATEDETKARILDPNDIGAWFNGRITDPNRVQIVESYDISEPGNEGKLVISPSDESHYGGHGGAWDITGDGYLDVGLVTITVDINGNIIYKISLPHEMGHALGLIGHAETLSQELTTLKAHPVNDPGGSPRFADIKTAKIANEDSYIHGQGDYGPNNLLRAGYVVDLKFPDEK
jgi:hypothetical protein